MLHGLMIALALVWLIVFSLHANGGIVTRTRKKVVTHTKRFDPLVWDEITVRILGVPVWRSWQQR